MRMDGARAASQQRRSSCKEALHVKNSCSSSREAASSTLSVSLSSLDLARQGKSGKGSFHLHNNAATAE